MAVDRPMTIVEHLAELRQRLLVAIAALAAATSLCWFFADPLLSLLIRPVVAASGRGVIFVGVTEAFFVRLKLALLAGVFLSLPVVLYQVWAFVAVGLTPAERRYAMWLLPPALVLFVGGALFALVAIVPVGVRFLLSYQVPGVLEPMISVGAYVSFLTAFMLAFGAVFELPIVLIFLAKLGVVTPAQLAGGRRYALVAIVVLAAVLTPGGDVFSQLLMAVPAYLLYEASVWIARLVAPSPFAMRQAEGR
jgi:sec-independent protein translocase protein TatC